MPIPEPDLAHRLRALLREGRCQELLDEYAASADPIRGAPTVSLTVATAATRMGRLPEGEALATTALHAYRTRADDDGRTRALNLLGAIAFERGEIRLARTRWTEALEFSRATSDWLMIARTSNNLGSILHLTGEVKAAQGLFREAHSAYQRLADRREVVATLHNLALTHREGGDSVEAADLGDEAVRHAEAVGDRSWLALVLTGRAETLIEAGELALAAEALRRAERLAVEAGDAPELAEVKRVSALRWLRIGEAERALADAVAGIEIAALHNSALLHGECAAVAAVAADRGGQAAMASQYRADARAVFESLGAVNHLDRLDAA